jgi:hypothetical protein
LGFDLTECLKHFAQMNLAELGFEIAFQNLARPMFAWLLCLFTILPTKSKENNHQTPLAIIELFDAIIPAPLK